VHIVRRGGFNNFSLGYGGSKRGGRYEMACTLFASWMADCKDLKLCGMLHCDLEVCILSGQEDPINFQTGKELWWIKERWQVLKCLCSLILIDTEVET
jgi:hypothetical protein